METQIVACSKCCQIENIKSCKEQLLTQQDNAQPCRQLFAECWSFLARTLTLALYYPPCPSTTSTQTLGKVAAPPQITFRTEASAFVLNGMIYVFYG